MCCQIFCPEITAEEDPVAERPDRKGAVAVGLCLDCGKVAVGGTGQDFLKGGTTAWNGKRRITDGLQRSDPG